MNIDKELKEAYSAAYSAARSAAWSAESAYQINKVLEVLEG